MQVMQKEKKEFEIKIEMVSQALFTVTLPLSYIHVAMLCISVPAKSVLTYLTCELAELLACRAK